MKYTRITIENFTDYPVNSELEFRFGAYYPYTYGRVVGHEILPGTKWDPEPTARLLAEYIDPETEEIVEANVVMISNAGIGVHLLSAAEKPKPNHNSPWARK